MALYSGQCLGAIHIIESKNNWSQIWNPKSLAVRTAIRLTVVMIMWISMNIREQQIEGNYK